MSPAFPAATARSARYANVLNTVQAAQPPRQALGGGRPRPGVLPQPPAGVQHALHRQRRAQERVGDHHGPHRPALGLRADRHRLGRLRSRSHHRADPLAGRRDGRSHAADQQVPEPDHQLTTSRTSARRSDPPDVRQQRSARDRPRRDQLRADVRRRHQPREVLPRWSATRSASVARRTSTRSRTPTTALKAMRAQSGAGRCTPPRSSFTSVPAGTAAAANQMPITVTNDGDAPLSSARPPRRSRPTPTTAATRRRPTSRSSARTARATTLAAAPSSRSPTTRRRRRTRSPGRCRAARAPSTSASSRRAPTTRRSRVCSSRTTSDNAMDRVLLAGREHR